jgi:hypothetical protein
MSLRVNISSAHNEQNEAVIAYSSRASPGIGTGPHLSGELFKMMTGHLIAGQVLAAFLSPFRTWRPFDKPDAASNIGGLRDTIRAESWS